MPNSGFHRTTLEPNHFRERTVAPYGQACLHCARAKCKCILIGIEDKCERCTRLGKDCRPAPSVRRRTKSSSALKIAQVESKLDNLLAVLQNTGVISQASTDSGIASESENSVLGQPRETSSALVRPSIPDISPDLPGPEEYSFLHSQQDASLQSNEAVELLRKFRRENLNYLPFTYIPPHITPSGLAQERPFFWQCIKMVLTPNLIDREAQFAKVHDTIHRELLVEVAPSMDILYGVMTFMSWKTYSAKSFLNLYGHILMGLVCDLGINKPIFKEQPILPRFQRTIGLETREGTTRTTEERRTVLGCFLITSSIASSTFKGDALRWTPHMENSLKVLADAKECAEDELLVTLVRIQLVVDHVYRLCRDQEDCKIRSCMIECLQAQLESAKSQVPPSLQENKVVLMYLAHAELVIHESSLKLSLSTNLPEAEDIQSLYCTLHAAKAWLDIWLTVPPGHYMGISFTLLFQFCRALMDLYKLSTLDCPGWDKGVARDSANILHYLDKLKVNFQFSSEYLAQEADANMFEAAVNMISTIRRIWEPVLMEAWYPNTSESAESMGITKSDGIEKGFNFDFLGVDNAWMMEFLGAF